MASTTYLKWQNITAGNRNTWTMSMWIKTSVTNDEQPLFSSASDSNNQDLVFIEAGGKLRWWVYQGGAYVGQLRTDRLLRDANAWYHLVFVFDSTNSTADDRMRIYINGVQETSFTTRLNPPQNTNSLWNGTLWRNIGYDSSGGYTDEFDGSMSHINFVDGTALTPSAFGQTDANGVWTIKTSPSVTYGSQGFFILKDGNSVTDQSGNGNNFTVAGGTLTQTEDNPSNVFTVWNRNAKLNSTIDLTIGNTQAYSSNTSWRSLTGTLGASSGKFYYEAKPITHSYSVHGWISDNLINSTTDGGFAYDQDYSYGYKTYTGDVVYRESSGGGSTNYGALINPNDVLGCAIDIDNSKAYWSKNGVWLNSADPVNGTNGFSIQSGQTYVPAIAIRNNGSSPTAQLNFGNGYFGTTAVSSAGTNASGIGIFEYDVPTGYTALSTKGLNL